MRARGFEEDGEASAALAGAVSVSWIDTVFVFRTAELPAAEQL